MKQVYSIDIEPFVPFEERTEREQKISLESRKRIQAYSMVDFFMSSISYFDFFSHDMFDLIQQAKILCHELEEETVMLEHFLYLLTQPRKVEPLELTTILHSYKITSKNIRTISSTTGEKKQSGDSSPSFLKKNFLSLRKFTRAQFYHFLEFFMNSEFSDYILDNFIDFEEEIENDAIVFSPLVWRVMEKATYNAGYRFKTAVITPEIFFITLMEEKRLKVGKIIQKIVPEEIDWLLLRFKLIKRAYYHESLIRQKVSRSSFPFTYFYKRTIPEFAFDQFLGREDRRLEEIVVSFRNGLISDLISYDFSDYLESDLEYTIRSVRKIGLQRQYSF